MSDAEQAGPARARSCAAASSGQAVDRAPPVRLLLAERDIYISLAQAVPQRPLLCARPPQQSAPCRGLDGGRLVGEAAQLLAQQRAVARLVCHAPRLIAAKWQRVRHPKISASEANCNVTTHIQGFRR